MRKMLMSMLMTGCLGAMLVLVAGCEGGGGGSAADGHDFGANDPNLYVAMGDSITAAGYPAHLSGMLGATVINGGTPGAWSDSGAGAVHSALSRYKPGFLLILYGANDTIHEANQDGTINNLRAMIQAAKANQTIPIIGTLTPMIRVHEGWAGRARELSKKIRAMASSEGCRVADLEKAFGHNDSLLQDDGLHPTDAGSQVIAKTFLGRIR
jgi:lysophospholipase L1-like esterase